MAIKYITESGKEVEIINILADGTICDDMSKVDIRTLPNFDDFVKLLVGIALGKGKVDEKYRGTKGRPENLRKLEEAERQKKLEQEGKSE